MGKGKVKVKPKGGSEAKKVVSKPMAQKIIVKAKFDKDFVEKKMSNS